MKTRFAAFFVAALAVAAITTSSTRSHAEPVPDHAPSVATAQAPAPLGAIVLAQAVPAPSATAATASDSTADKAVPTDIGAAAQELPAIVAAAQAGKWFVVLGLALGLLIFAAERFLWADIPPKYLQWAMLGVAVLGALADSLVAGVPIAQALLGAIPVGVTAISTYHVFDAHAPAPSPAGAKA